MTKATESLREYDRPADRIRQHMQASENPVLILEGYADLLVLKPLLDDVDVFHVDGKKNVISVARSLTGWSIEDFVCVSDPDFDDPDEVRDLDHVHHPYHANDLEALLIKLDVLATLLEHIGSASKLAALHGAPRLVEILINATSPVTALRENNSNLKWGIPFDDVPLAEKIDKSNLALRTDSYMRALINRMESPPPFESLCFAVQSGPSSKSVYRGKDVMAFAGVALRKLAGNLQQAATDPDHLSAQLRSSGGYALSRCVWFIELKARLADITKRRTQQ